MKEKWVVIVGSSRTGQNTDLLADYISEGLSQSKYDVSKYILKHEDIRTCNGCEQCLKTGECAIKDEWTQILHEIFLADGVVLASPSYHYNMSAQMKAFIDRAFQIKSYRAFNHLENPQKALVLGVCRGKQKESMGYTVESMTEALEDMNFKILSELEYYNTKEIPVKDNHMIKEIMIESVMNSITEEGQKYRRN